MTAAGELGSGDQVIVTPAMPGTLAAGVDSGAYAYDGAALQMASSSANAAYH